MENSYYVPDSLFDSNNELEIPNLRLDVQPQAVEIPFVCYGGAKAYIRYALSRHPSLLY